MRGRGLGVACVVVGLGSLAIGGTLAALDLGALYTDISADPLGPGPENGKETSREILWHVGLAAAGVPVTSIGWFLIRRSRAGRR